MREYIRPVWFWGLRVATPLVTPRLRGFAAERSTRPPQWPVAPRDECQTHRYHWRVREYPWNLEWKDRGSISKMTPKKLSLWVKRNCGTNYHSENYLRKLFAEDISHSCIFLFYIYFIRDVAYCYTKSFSFLYMHFLPLPFIYLILLKKI